MLELKEPVEIDIPCDPEEEVLSSLEFQKRKSSQETPGYDLRGNRFNYKCNIFLT